MCKKQVYADFGLSMLRNAVTNSRAINKKATYVAYS